MTTSGGLGLLRLAYDKVGKSVPTEALYGKPIQQYFMAGVAPTAGEWKLQGSMSAQSGELKPGRLYAIDRVCVIGKTSAVLQGAIRFVHASFGGCRPGGSIQCAKKGDALEATYGNEVLEFSQHGKNGTHPVFSSDFPLSLYFISTVNNAPAEWVVEFRDVTGVATSTTQEDVNAAYEAALDDAQTQAILTVVAGDSLQVQSDRGNCVYRATEFTGVYVTMGTTTAPIDVLQPNALYATRWNHQTYCREARDCPVYMAGAGGGPLFTLTLASYLAGA